MATATTSSISEAVVNYLNMKTTGALLLTGAWGCGKTYHIKNHIFPLVETTTSYVPIIVSLYGETDKNNVANKVLFAYLDYKGKEINLGTGTITKGIKNILDGIPAIKKIIDIEKILAGTSENLFHFIAHKNVLICFDDIERMSEKLNIDDFLGIINDLVESKGCKVILIANEAEIKKGIMYKEKTIEKTIQFTPNLEEIYNSIVSDYLDDNFKSFLIDNKLFYIETLTADTSDKNLNAELTKSFSNIRTIKFALEHFRIPFNYLVEKSEIKDYTKTQLKNIWIFTLAISIEFKKPNSISFFDRKKLDEQQTTASDIKSFENLVFSKLTDVQDQDHNNDSEYCESFKRKYYNRLAESYVFFDQQYDFITSGKKIDKEIFVKNVEQSFKVNEGQINPAHELLNSFFRNGYWNYSNVEFKKTLQQLLTYCEEGKFEDIISYLNVGFSVLRFHEIINISKNNIITKLETGLNIFLTKFNLNNYDKMQFEIMRSEFNDENLQTVIRFIETRIKELERENANNESIRLEATLESDLVSFVKEFMPSRSDIRGLDKPLFHIFSSKTVQNSVSKWEPSGIAHLISLLKIRYLETPFIENLIEEEKFLTDIQTGISEIDTSLKTLSNYMLLYHLKPLLSECIEKLRSQAGRSF